MHGPGDHRFSSIRTLLRVKADFLQTPPHLAGSEVRKRVVYMGQTVGYLLLACFSVNSATTRCVPFINVRAEKRLEPCRRCSSSFACSASWLRTEQIFSTPSASF